MTQALDPEALKDAAKALWEKQGESLEQGYVNTYESLSPEFHQKAEAAAQAAIAAYHATLPIGGEREAVERVREMEASIYDRCKLWPELTADGQMALIEYRNFAHDVITELLALRSTKPTIGDDVAGIVERLRNRSSWLRDNSDVDEEDPDAVLMTQARDTITRLSEALGEARRVVERIVDGDVPRAIWVKYRRDGAPCKHDRCEHNVPMHDDCSHCIARFAHESLPPKDDTL